MTRQTKKKSAAGKDVILRADKKLFSRLLIIGQSRKIDLREILSYSLGTVSYPLAQGCQGEIGQGARFF